MHTRSMGCSVGWGEAGSPHGEKTLLALLDRAFGAQVRSRRPTAAWLQIGPVRGSNAHHPRAGASLWAEESLARSLDDLKKTIGAMARDLAIVAETLALYVRYFLTMTPPLPQSEHQAAQLLGKQRFHVFVAQVAELSSEDSWTN